MNPQPWEHDFYQLYYVNGVWPTCPYHGDKRPGLIRIDEDPLSKWQCPVCTLKFDFRGRAHGEFCSTKGREAVADHEEGLIEAIELYLSHKS